MGYHVLLPLGLAIIFLVGACTLKNDDNVQIDLFILEEPLKTKAVPTDSSFANKIEYVDVYTVNRNIDSKQFNRNWNPEVRPQRRLQKMHNNFWNSKNTENEDLQEKMDLKKLLGLNFKVQIGK